MQREQIGHVGHLGAARMVAGRRSPADESADALEEAGEDHDGGEAHEGVAPRRGLGKEVRDAVARGLDAKHRGGLGGLGWARLAGARCGGGDYPTGSAGGGARGTHAGAGCTARRGEGGARGEGRHRGAGALRVPGGAALAMGTGMGEGQRGDGGPRVEKQLRVRAKGGRRGTHRALRIVAFASGVNVFGATFVDSSCEHAVHERWAFGGIVKTQCRADFPSGGGMVPAWGRSSVILIDRNWKVKHRKGGFSEHVTETAAAIG